MRMGLVRTLAVAAAVLAIGAAGVRAQERDLSFVVVAMPATVLIDADGKKFAAEGDRGRVSLSEVYTMPNIAMGVGIPVGNAQLDLLGGAGIIINDGFRSFMLQAIVDVTWMAANSLEIGPRAGLVYLPNPEWLENDDLDFDSDWGFLLGLQIAMGDKIQYIVAVDLIDFSLDVKDRGVGVVSEDKLDMTALAIQFGVRGEF